MAFASNLLKREEMFILVNMSGAELTTKCGVSGPDQQRGGGGGERAGGGGERGRWRRSVVIMSPHSLCYC